MSNIGKKLVQKKLPFAIIPSDKSPASVHKKPIENLSPNVAVVSRKRKTSAETENVRAKKRITDSKVSLSAVDSVEISDEDNEAPREDVKDKSFDRSNMIVPGETQRTPTSSEAALHIKLPGSSKKKRIKMDLKSPKAVVNEDNDDEVVHLSDEEVCSTKKSKKSARKSNKKKPQTAALSPVNTVNLKAPEKVLAEDLSKSNIEVSPLKTKAEPENSLAEQDSNKNLVTKTEVPEKPEETPNSDTLASDEIPKLTVNQPEEAAGSPEVPDTLDALVKSSPADDSINDELIEMLSDDSSCSSKDKTSPNADGSFNTSSNKNEVKNYTPKQLARRQEQMNRRAEREAERQKERELKEHQRLKEKEAREEAKRREKEEKEEARKKEKEERDRKRQAELDKKEEEKRLKEEERKRIVDQREEEKRLKEEERKRQAEQREEEKRKREELAKKKEIEDETRKKRAAEAFSKFFVPKKKTVDTAVNDDENSKDSAASVDSVGVVKSNFMPFQIREGMKVAPSVRRTLNEDQIVDLEGSLNIGVPLKSLYLVELKQSGRVPMKSVKTAWPVEDQNDVMIVDELQGVGEDIQADQEKMKMKYRAKRLMFIENRRPAYFGTWRKKSSIITARRPLAVDPKFFDYEVDSDDEWEEEEPGESLHGSDSEKEKDKDGDEDEYEVDNDFFVPHGHLSDEEMQQNDDGLEENNHPDAQKAKLKILQQEFAAEMKKKTEKIKPRLIGCIWMNGDEDESGCSKSDDSEKKYHCSDIIWRILKAREMMTSADGVKLQDDVEPEIVKPEEDVEKTPAVKTQARAKFNDDTIKLLINLIHGNTNGKKFIIKEFQSHRLKNFHQDPDFLEFANKTIDEKVQEISVYKTCPDDGPMFGKKCWYVKPEVIQEHFGDEKLKMPNEWVYTLQKEVKERKPKPAIVDGAKQEVVKETEQVEIQPEEVEEVEKFGETKDDKPEDFKSTPWPSSLDNPNSPPKGSQMPKKRVQLLMSVPRGEEIPQTKKNNLISQYLKANQPTAASMPKVDDDVITID